MSHAASIRALALAVGVMLGGLIAPSPTRADSILGVAVQPLVDIISSGDALSLEIIIVTNSTPAFRFLPTELLITGDLISVDIFVDSGLLTVFDSLIEDVPLGTFGAGAYPFHIRLYRPAYLSPSLEDEFLGSFAVVPEPSSLALIATGLVALLLRRGARRTL